MASASESRLRTGTSKQAAGKKNRPSFHCSECGWMTAKWVGRCGECQEWGTVIEVTVTAGPKTTAVSIANPAQPIDAVTAESAQAIPTGMPEFDRVLGGGLVPGAVILVAGEPGIGKSTLLLDVAGKMAGDGRQVLYITGEESAGQVRLRAERIGSMHSGLLLAAENDLGTVLGHIAANDPSLVVVDSVQTIASAQVEGTAGGVSQVREVTSALIASAKSRNIPMLIVGHVTKDGSVAGPRTLEHLVDVVCQFEGDRHAGLRMVRAVKNRYGATDEVGCFELTDAGIIGLSDPSGLFMTRTAGQIPGTCITVTLEGRRPLALEVQALTMDSGQANPRRTTSGVDSQRLAMILAVLQRHLGARLSNTEVYISTVGGARVTEPAADLAIALAAASSIADSPLRERTAAFGEVGLSGDIRPVTGLTKRLTEAHRLGFTHAIIPAGNLSPTGPRPPEGLRIAEAATLVEATRLALPDGENRPKARSSK